jgi:hypothetical protein
MYVSHGSGTECLLDYCGRRFKAQEENSAMRNGLKYLPGSVEAVQLRQSNIEHDDVRLQRRRLRQGVESITGLSNDLEVLPFVESGTNELPNRQMVFDHQNPANWHANK